MLYLFQIQHTIKKSNKYVNNKFNVQQKVILYESYEKKNNNKKFKFGRLALNIHCFIRTIKYNQYCLKRFLVCFKRMVRSHHKQGSFVGDLY